MAIIIKSKHELEILREAGRINAQALERTSQAVRPGVTTEELDRIAEDYIRSHGAEPAFLNYPNGSFPGHPYPATINASVNDELVHGLPSERRLQNGDIISIDCGTVWKGYVGDSALTLPVGTVSSQAKRLMDVTRKALELAIDQCRPGKRFGDISATIQEWVESQGYNVVREYTGHGVGQNMHEDPQIPNWGTRNRGAALRPGMTFALEPMVTVGPPILYVKDDYWTVATRDGSLCAHFEHSIAVTDGEPQILTLP
ncbi:MAG: type I methionyl aminopeptidase [Chloroflexota bacterium]|nr:type I methionyl aminopeptidase [Chloroflexota bacterium]